MTEKDILFQDRHLVACLKAPGLLSETGGMPELLADLIGGSVYCVHRLDRAVGGVMVYARTKEAAAALSGAIAAGKMKKRYLAVVCGRPQEKEAVWKDLLYHDAERNKSYVVKRMRRGVREAELSYSSIPAEAIRSGCSLPRALSPWRATGATAARFGTARSRSGRLRSRSPIP